MIKRGQILQSVSLGSDLEPWPLSTFSESYFNFIPSPNSFSKIFIVGKADLLAKVKAKKPPSESADGKIAAIRLFLAAGLVYCVTTFTKQAGGERKIKDLVCRNNMDSVFMA
jgi:hypothetical protein